MIPWSTEFPLNEYVDPPVPSNCDTFASESLDGQLSLSVERTEFLPLIQTSSLE